MNIFKSKPNKKYKTLAEAIERKTSLIESKKDLLVKISGHNSQLSKIEGQIREERNAIRGYSNPKVHDYKKAKEKHECSLNNLLQEQENISALFKQDSTALGSVNSELENIDQVVSVGEVIEHQSAVVKKAEMIESIQQQIDEQQAIENARNDAGIDTSMLYHKKVELLADIAQGDDKHAELNEISAEITSLEKKKFEISATKEAAAREAAQVKGVLEQRLQKERQGLERLQETTKSVLDQFLLTESKKLCKEYLLCANKTRKYMLRLAALQELIIDQGKRKGNVIFPKDIRACIPDIVQSLAPNASDNGVLLDGKIMQDSGFMNKIIKTEIERFEAMGIVSIYSR